MLQNKPTKTEIQVIEKRNINRAQQENQQKILKLDSEIENFKKQILLECKNSVKFNRIIRYLETTVVAEEKKADLKRNKLESSKVRNESS